MDDYRSALRNGLVVLDTNALLNLYRYTDETRRDLIRVLQSLGDSLWIPHQVVREFWQNRENVLRNRPRDAEAVLEKLKKYEDDAARELRTWSNRVSLPDKVRDDLLAELRATFAKLTEVISNDTMKGVRAADTAGDIVLNRLAPNAV